MSPSLHKTLTALAILAAAIALVAISLHDAGAQPRAAAVPANCDRGQLLVADSQGRFVCTSPRSALQLSGCQTGDFVVTDSSGDLRCERPSSTTWNVRALLPSCSSNELLVSEGFGAWRCASARSLGILPSCSSGEILVSEGSGSWRCTSR
jgi:hypothetical protein